MGPEPLALCLQLQLLKKIQFLGIILAWLVKNTWQECSLNLAYHWFAYNQFSLLGGMKIPFLLVSVIDNCSCLRITTAGPLNSLQFTSQIFLQGALYNWVNFLPRKCSQEVGLTNCIRSFLGIDRCHSSCHFNYITSPVTCQPIEKWNKTCSPATIEVRGGTITVQSLLHQTLFASKMRTWAKLRKGMETGRAGRGLWSDWWIPILLTYKMYH